MTTVRRTAGAWLFLDASRNELGESPLLFRRPIRVGRLHDNGEQAFYHLSGRSLNTWDVIDFRRSLPAVKEGEIVVIGDAGAYTISHATRYSGLAPAVYLVNRDSKIQMIRRRETVSDVSAPMEPANGK